MLARVAETLFWMSRYLERAENMARLINVNANLLLDIPKKTTLGWEPLIDITGTREHYLISNENFEERSVLRYLVSDVDSPVSIVSALKSARENARTIRDVIPREAWEQINALNYYATDQLGAGLSKRGRFSYLKEIILRNQTISGLLAGTMNQDQGYLFIRMGRNLERADMTTRIIDVRTANLITNENMELRPFENIQWMSVLKSLTAYQMYRQSMQARVRRGDVLKFLFQSKKFPRSIYFCAQQLEQCVLQLPNFDAVLHLIHALMDMVQGADLEAFDQNQLHEFIDQCQIEFNAIHNALVDNYFLSGRIYKQAPRQVQKAG